MISIKRPAQTMVLAFGLVALAGPVSAQPQAAPGGTAPQAAPQQQAVNVSDAELEKFAAAYEASMDIRQDFIEQLNNVDNAEQAQQLQQQANTEITAAIEDEGLSVEEYGAIAQAVTQSPELQQRLSERLPQQ